MDGDEHAGASGPQGAAHPAVHPGGRRSLGPRARRRLPARHPGACRPGGAAACTDLERDVLRGRERLGQVDPARGHGGRLGAQPRGRHAELRLLDARLALRPERGHRDATRPAAPLERVLFAGGELLQRGDRRRGVRPDGLPQPGDRSPGCGRPSGRTPRRRSPRCRSSPPAKRTRSKGAAGRVASRCPRSGRSASRASRRRSSACRPRG